MTSTGVLSAPRAAGQPDNPGQAQRSSRSRRERLLLPALLVCGPVLGLVVVGSSAPRQSRPERELLGPWLRWSTAPWRLVAPTGHGQLVVALAVLALVLTWSAVAWLISRGHGSRLALPAAVLWAAPFALAPPFMSRDAYAYVAQGEVLRRGMDPYRHPVNDLGPSQLLSVVDPLWRHTTPPYGPLALRLVQGSAVVGHHHPILALVALRVLAVVSVVVAVVVLRRLVPASQRLLVTWVACSPLVLLQVVTAAHLEGVASALLLAAVLVHTRGHPLMAGALVVLAAEIKVTALVVLVALLAHALRSARPRAALRLCLGAALTAGSAVLLLPHDPFGWIRGLGTPARSWDPFAVASSGYLGLSELLTRLHLDGGSWLRPGVQLAVLLLGAATAGRLLLRAGHDPYWDVAALLLVVTLANPVLWPWYLVPVALLLLAAGRTTAAAALSASATLMALPLHVVAAQRLAVAAEATALLLLVLTRHRARQQVPEAARATNDRSDEKDDRKTVDVTTRQPSSSRTPDRLRDAQ
jgi:hypothetical protein